jgi:SAM-dependent methyltransferase
MQPKPEFLGPDAASAFRDASVADAYEYRPPYPEETFEVLAGLIADSPRAVLDAGCGTGYVARRLVSRVDRIDALDISTAMIARGKCLPGGDHPGLTWIAGSAEEAPLRPPYALITAGDSLHWMDWDTVMPRFAEVLTPHGYLAILGVEQLPAPWDEDLWPIRRRYSTIPNFQYYDHVQGLEERGLFTRVGEHRTGKVPFTQPLDDYVESFHGRAAFSRERMTGEDAAALDEAVRSLVRRHSGEMVELELVAEIVWGRPAVPPHPPGPFLP